MGIRDDYRVPANEELSERVENRIKEIDHMIFRKKFTLEYAKGALRRVMKERPPNNHKSQQFKDSAILEALLDLAYLRDMFQAGLFRMDVISPRAKKSLRITM